MAKVMIQTKWQGIWGELVRAPGTNTEYRCSPEGELEVSEEDAREFCSTSGFRRKPMAPPVVPGKQRKQPLKEAPAPEAKPAKAVEDATEEVVE